jgi:N-acetylglucosaminyldiphosphoundecaprenol N-acetyl-beta-D-mannosaminyltransferase
LHRQISAMEHINILGIPVINSTTKKVNQAFEDILSRTFQKCYTVYFVNAYGGNLSFEDKDFTKALKEADFLLNDGIGVDMAAWFQGRKFEENLNGSDLIDEGEFLKICAAKGFTVFILGAKQEVLDLAVANYLKEYPGLQIVGSHHGYFNHYGDDQSLPVVELINSTKADVLLVGFGNPRQEHWINNYKSQLQCKLAIGYGGSIDQVAKVVPRAPKFWISIRMEWLFRLFQEPQRLWRRYLIGNTVFLSRALFRREGLYSKV